METWYYEVVSIDGDYANLKRCDIESDDLKLVAEFKVLCSCISTIAAPFYCVSTSIFKAVAILWIYTMQMLWQYLHILASCYPASYFRIKLVKRIAACGLHIVVPVPFKTRNEKQ